MGTKNNSSLNYDTRIYNAIRTIAGHKIIDPNSGTIKDAKKTLGYVAAIHSDPDEDLYGTIDVREYISNENYQGEDTANDNVGLHEGVYLSAIQDNSSGVVLLPMMFSDVVIVTDPETVTEYVIKYSHVDQMQLQAHESVTVGVTETEAYQNTSDTPDYNELAPTGRQAATQYTPDGARTIVNKDKSGTPAAEFDVLGTGIDGHVGNLHFGADNSKIFLGASTATDPAVLGNELADILSSILSLLSNVTVATSIGPQPFINVAAFADLQAKIASYKASCSNFLSKNVKLT